MGGKAWTDDDRAYLLAAASSHTIVGLAEHLGRTIKAVRWECEKLGVKPADGRTTAEARARLSKARTTSEWTDTEQRCTKCGLWKPHAEFSPDRLTASGRSTWCKQCVRERAQWRRENIPEEREKQRAATHRHYRKTHPDWKPQVVYRKDAQGRECSKCRVYKPWSEFPARSQQGSRNGGQCKLCVATRIRRERWRSIYGITVEQGEYLEKLRGDVCWLCGEPEIKRLFLSLDHDHGCDQGHPPEKACKHCIRGLLDTLCNNVIGLAEQRPALAARFSDYLARRPLLHSTT